MARKLKEYEVKAMASCFVEATSEAEAIKNSPDLGSWGMSDADREDNGDGIFRVIAYVTQNVQAKNEEDALMNVVDDADAEWDIDGYEANEE